MPIKMTLACSRCRREDTVDLQKLEEATALEKLQERKAATLEKLKAFVASLPKDELPDFFAISGDQVVTHSYLCDPQDEKKRSCSKRVSDLVTDITELQERKPRTKKSAEEAQ